MGRSDRASRWARHVPLPRAAQVRLDTTLDGALDRALRIQRPAVVAYLERAQSRNPHMTPAQLVGLLERRYRATVTGIGGASGAAAAVPGAGTGAALASGAAEITAFVSATALFVLALAELHGVPVSDPELRRALVVAVLVGDTENLAVEAGERSGSHWAQLLARGAAQGGRRATGLDDRVRRLLLTRFGARQGALLLGRALPLGIGAGIGAAGNAALARGAIAAARRAFGPPPDRFPPRIIDVDEVTSTARRPQPRPSR
jgi:hypothetical protein